MFDQLKPAHAEFMLGKWDGFAINTGHSSLEQQFKWAGKDFRSLDDVDPVMVWEEDGRRTWNSDFGHAQVRRCFTHTWSHRNAANKTTRYAKSSIVVSSPPG